MNNVTGLPDGSMADCDHYRSRLPRWRYQLRERMLPILRWEAPYLAWLQGTLRTPVLDWYFVLTANLGTHTFFMIVLPILFWCGEMEVGRGMVHVLACGVIFSGYLKDLCCLPRPLSPPLCRFPMSGSAAQEYGFPSTHATNAVSVTVYALYLLRKEPSGPSKANTLLQAILYLYAFSIVLGRLYCGMHGFFDVTLGSVLGAGISLAQCAYGRFFDDYIHRATLGDLLVIVFCILLLVRIHPEPADDCPCFDDSVAFAGAVIGIEYGSWHFSKSDHAWSPAAWRNASFDLDSTGYGSVVARIVVGMVMIFLWRTLIKSLMLRVLPPVFHVIEILGLTLPRKFFKQASRYTGIPKLRGDDNIIPAPSEIPPLLSSVQHPRKRSDLIGPHSEAHVYENLVYPEKRRRDDCSAGYGSGNCGLAGTDSSEGCKKDINAAVGSRKLPEVKISKSDEYESIMGTRLDSETHGIHQTSLNDFSTVRPETRYTQSSSKQTFPTVNKPRERFDVEVVTKLIVYSGIAWLAVEGNNILFGMLGLRMVK